MTIRQKILRVFSVLALVIALMGAGNLVMIRRMIYTGESALRDIRAFERASSDILVQLEQLASVSREGRAEEPELSERVNRLTRRTQAWTSSGNNMHIDRFVRKVRDFERNYPELPGDERLKWMEDLQLQMDVTLGFLRQDTERLLGTVRRDQRLNVIASVSIVLVSFAACFGLGARFAKYFTERLHRVNDMASAIAAGELDKPIEWNAEKEFMEISDSINRLMHNLSQADAEISKEVNDRMFAEKKALEAARAKSAFLAHMSHEFRTPLNGILGYTQVLLMDKGLSDKNRQVVKSLKRSGESLLELINDVLDLSKIEARSMRVQKSRFYLLDMLESLKESYADQVRSKGLDFRVEIGSSVPEDLLSDPIRLRQILVNLIGNAFKFTDSGRITLKVTAEKNNVIFEVLDTGKGIAPENLDKIFKPFVQVEPEGGRANKGSGLGLSISNSLLEMLDSRMQVESEVGKGSRFWFVLPQPEREGRRLVLPASQVRGYHGEMRRLMLLDPKRKCANNLTPLLKRTGFEVFEPTRAEQALQDCIRIRPDLILLDQDLPDMDGLAALEQLRDQYFKLELTPPPCVMITDHSRVEDRTACLAAGAADVLGKPVRFMDVLRILQRFLEIEWIYGDSNLEGGEAPVPTDEPVTPPPDPVLRQLLSFARAGDIRKLRETVDYMRGQEPRLDPFCRKVSSLCSNYQMNALVEFLLRNIQSNPIPTHE
jgi:signal transduction histidine kinase/CheY-like chemotaxis protein